MLKKHSRDGVISLVALKRGMTALSPLPNPFWYTAPSSFGEEHANELWRKFMHLSVALSFRNSSCVFHSHMRDLMICRIAPRPRTSASAQGKCLLVDDAILEVQICELRGAGSQALPTITHLANIVNVRHSHMHQRSAACMNGH